MLILGGQSTLNLERICKDFGRIASDLLGGGLIDTQLGKDPQRLWKDLEGSPLILGGFNWHSTWKGSAKTLEGLPLILGGGRLTLNLERIHKDFGRIASDNVDPGGSINTQLGKDLQRLLKDHLWQCWSWGVNQHSTWKGSAKTGRIASDNVDPGGINGHSTWKGSAKTLEGSDCLWQCWSWWGCQSTLNLERKDHLWSWGGQLTLNLERICKDFWRITLTMLILGGVDWHSTWKGSAKTLEGSGRITSDPGGGWSTLNLERIRRLCKDHLWSFGRVNRHSTWKGSAKTLEGLPLTMLILGEWCWLTLNLERIRKDFGRIKSPLTMLILGWVDKHSAWKGSTKTLEGSPLTMLILGVDRHSTWKGSTKTLEGLPLILWGGWLTFNLERIRKDFGRITSDNVYPGGSKSLHIKVFADPFQVECRSTPPPRINIVRGNPILPKSLQILSKLSVNWHPSPGSTLSEAILPKSLRILSKLSVNRPPRINIVRGDPSKVFVDPFQVVLINPLGSTLSEVILPKSLGILSKLSVNWPPHLPRINIVRGNPSKVFADPFQVECRLTPPQDQHSQRWSFQSLCRSFPNWVSIDPPTSEIL